MKSIVFALLAICLLGSAAHAVIKVVGNGDSMRFDSADFPPGMKADYEIMRAKCIKCHSLEWVVVAIQTGIAPISGQPFDRSATKSYGNKMLRKPGSDMNKQEVKKVVELMNYLLDQAAK